MTMNYWTDQDDTQLIVLWELDADTDAIAARLRRSRKAVYNRVQVLRAKGLIFAPAGAYRPNAGSRVPCEQCGTLFTRCRVTQRLCGAKECKLAACRVPESTVRRDGICPRCGTNPRPRRPDGRLRGWCRPCESKQKAQYCRTEAGKATYRRWSTSEKGRAALARRYAKRKESTS